eukprot:scaffold22792_cov43-Prasinocladus_malaysianus.AAC.1
MTLPPGSRTRSAGPATRGPGEVDPRLPFAVDHWHTSLCTERQAIRPGFLTHAHGDHTQNLDAWCQRPGSVLHCTEDTWRL